MTETDIRDIPLFILRERAHVVTSAEIFAKRVEEAASRMAFLSGSDKDGFRVMGCALYLSKPDLQGPDDRGIFTVTIPAQEGPDSNVSWRTKDPTANYDSVIQFTVMPLTPITMSKPRIKVFTRCTHLLAFAAYARLWLELRDDFEVLQCVTLPGSTSFRQLPKSLMSWVVSHRRPENTAPRNASVPILNRKPVLKSTLWLYGEHKKGRTIPEMVEDYKAIRKRNKEEPLPEDSDVQDVMRQALKRMRIKERRTK